MMQDAEKTAAKHVVETPSKLIAAERETLLRLPRKADREAHAKQRLRHLLAFFPVLRAVTAMKLVASHILGYSFGSHRESAGIDYLLR